MIVNGRQVSLQELLELVANDLPGPMYAPPYDSPLEDAFARQLVKHLDPSVRLHTQFEVSTICGTFRIDFVVETRSKKVGFECDGKEYHEVWRDECRDALILGSRGVDAIYHFPGAALTYHVNDCLWLATLCDPEIFGDGARGDLDHIASDDARRSAWRIDRGCDELSITYRGERGLVTNRIFRRSAPTSEKAMTSTGSACGASRSMPAPRISMN